MEEVESDEHLFGDLSTQMHRDACVVIALDDFEEVNAEDLEHKAEVVAVGTFVHEAVEELHYLAVVLREGLLLLLVGGVSERTKCRCA